MTSSGVFPYDIFICVLRECTTASVVCFAQTCRLFRCAAAVELRRRYSYILRAFFGNRATVFDEILTCHGAIISGSVALSFFMWTDDWGPGDMDVYVGMDTYDDFVVDLERLHLAELDVDMGGRAPSTYHGIKRVRRYFTAAGKILDVIQGTTANPVKSLAYFWTSLVVNFITPSGAACIFPAHTLDHVGLVTDVNLSDKLLAARDKYTARGFRFAVANSWAPIPVASSEEDRMICDRAILVLDFCSVWANDPYNPPLPLHRVGAGWALM